LGEKSENRRGGIFLTHTVHVDWSMVLAWGRSLPKNGSWKLFSCYSASVCHLSVTLSSALHSCNVT